MKIGNLEKSLGMGVALAGAAALVPKTREYIHKAIDYIDKKIDYAKERAENFRREKYMGKIRKHQTP